MTEQRPLVFLRYERDNEKSRIDANEMAASLYKCGHVICCTCPNDVEPFIPGQGPDEGLSVELAQELMAMGTAALVFFTRVRKSNLGFSDKLKVLEMLRADCRREREERQRTENMVAGFRAQMRAPKPARGIPTEVGDPHVCLKCGPKPGAN